MLQTKFMLFSVVALLAVGTAVAIIEGQDAERGQFPYFAYLETYKAKSWSLTSPRKVYRRCGGSLISNQHILTSAHCLAVSDGAEVHLGLLRLYDNKEEGRQSFNVTKKDYFIYPSFKKEQQFLYDIAIIKLPSPVKPSDYVQPIQLAPVPITPGSNVITTGYGLVKTKVLPHNLQYTKFNVIDTKNCVKEIETHKLISKYSIACAKGISSSLCIGDVGGPLVSVDTGKLVGVAIFTYRDCEVGPQGFTGIYAYREWIDGVVEGVIRKAEKKQK